MKIQEHIYKPLPKGLIIDKSQIHGCGLFAQEDFPKDTFFGVSHIHASLVPGETWDMTFSFEEQKIKLYFRGNHLDQEVRVDNILKKEEVFPNGLIRTPLGGFINHSEDANLNFFYVNAGLWGVSSNRDIVKGEELTLNYQYTPCGVIKQ